MHPYQQLPARAFWRAAVAEPSIEAIGDVWQPKFTIDQDAPLITAGSCFAARIGRALLDHGMNWYDAELPPPGLTEQERRARHYREFSFRTGNIYTASALKQWIFWTFARSEASAEFWVEDDRFYDPCRPAVEPDGYDSIDEMLEARTRTFSAIRDAVTNASCFIITLGLTEAWIHRTRRTVYPVCPGTVRGLFDPAEHEFHNYSFGEVHRDLSDTIELLHEINPELRILLTVSPVPLTATASGQHALVANAYTKSTLRAVAGQLVREHETVDYFPSYELITGQPFRSSFYKANLREVSEEGVDFVIRHLMTALQGSVDRAEPTRVAPRESGGDECDDAILDYYSPR